MNRLKTFMFLAALFVSIILAVGFVLNAYDTFSRNKTAFEMSFNGNIHDIDFNAFTDEMILKIQPDNGAIYQINEGMDVTILPSGEILRFSLDIAAIVKGETVHYQTYFTNVGTAKLKFFIAYEIGNLNTDPKVNRNFATTLKLIGEAPWENINQNLAVYDYSSLRIDSHNSRGSPENVWINIYTPPQSNSRTFLVQKDGSLKRIMTETRLPSNQYEVLNFTPAINEQNSYLGNNRLSYYFNLKPDQTNPEAVDRFLAVQDWAEAVKNRDGRAQFEMLTKKQQEASLEHYEKLGWTTGSASPWIANYLIETNEMEATVTFQYTTADIKEGLYAGEYKQILLFAEEDGKLKIDKYSAW